MRRFLIFIVFSLNLLPMVTGNNEGTIKAQTLDNEYGYECEDIGNDGEPFTYISILPCDAVEICRDMCPYCFKFFDCDEIGAHEYKEIREQTEKTDEDSSGLIGGGGSHHGNQSGQEESVWDKIQKEIKEEKAKTGPSYFKNITRNKFYTDLWNMIYLPGNIKQGNLGTCGAAVLCKLLTERTPYAFYKAAKEIYENGRYSQWGVSLPEEMKICTTADFKKWGISSAEAIMETAIINANNCLNEYSPFNDDGNTFSSATWPLFLYDFIKEHITERVSTINIPSTSALSILNYDDFIIAGVHSENNSISTGYPNHYVQLKGYDGTGLKYWTGGETHTSYKNAEGIYWILIVRK